MTLNLILAQIRDRYGRIAYTHKTHEKAREIYSKWSLCLRWATIILGVITFGGLLAALGTDTPGYLVASLVVTVFNLALAFVSLSFDPAAIAERHRQAAKQFLAIRDRYESFVTDLMSDSLDEPSAHTLRDQLEEASRHAFQGAPDTGPRAYALARAALQLREELTFSDEEIDHLLIGSLRLHQTPPRAAKGLRPGN